MKLLVALVVVGALLAFSNRAEGASKGPKVTHKVRGPGKQREVTAITLGSLGFGIP